MENDLPQLYGLFQTGLYVLGALGVGVSAAWAVSAYSKHKHEPERLRALKELEEGRKDKTIDLLETPDYREFLKKREGYGRTLVDAHREKIDPEVGNIYPPGLETTLDAMFGEISH